jgi:hypothetical protein
MNAEATTYEKFLIGDDEDREDDREAIRLEAERTAILEARRLAKKKNETPHLP